MQSVTLYTKTYCPFCHRAKHLLTRKGVSFEEIDLQVDPSRFEEMLTRANGRRTVPQIFIGDQHIGGSDDLQSLEQQGELDPLLKAS